MLAITPLNCHINSHNYQITKKKLTLIIHCLTIAPLRESDKVLVYANDTDVFTLLLKHPHEFNSNSNSSGSPINVSYVFSVLGEEICGSILSLHAITGCDTIRNCFGKSKEFWVKQFLAQKDNHRLIESFLKIQKEVTEASYIELEKFVCYCYLPKKSAKFVSLDFVSTRYYLFKRCNAESAKLPPTLCAFKKHITRAFFQLSIWSEASKSHIITHDPLDYRWEINNGKIVPVTTDIEIAAKAIIELVACNCGGECSNLRCKCKKNNVSCTDFCGCNEMCENVDVKISDYTTEELTEDDSTCAEID